MESTSPTLYFAYGSNLWLDQMHRRCPGNNYISIGILRDWKWFICEYGYANVIESPGDIVYGFVYTLTPSDEEKLDGYEHVPENYVKQIHPVELVGDGLVEKNVDGLVYVDIHRVVEGTIRQEYIVRMNHAIQDAEEKGVPKDYVEKYLRPFIPVL